MNPSQIVKKAIKNAVRSFGYDIVRQNNRPSVTLLGLREFKFQTIIDVGANIGQFAKNILSFFPCATLYCFEPLAGPFNALSKWSKTQKGTIVLFNMAVGQDQGEVEFILHENHTPSSSLLNTTKLSEQLYPFTKEQKRIRVEQTTLDEMHKEGRVELLPEILIKVDVQGYEDRVIAGGTKIFNAASACILEVCLDPLYEKQAGFRNLLTTLDDLGYRYAGNLEQSYGGDGHCIFLDAVFLRRI